MNVAKLLESEIKNQTESHAYLMIGDRREADKAIDFIVKSRNILSVDITRIGDAVGETAKKEIKVEETRQLLRDISFSPSGKLRLVVIYNSEKLNASSGNVLLKNLEEPTGPVVFVLIANTPNILSTIKSRCRVLNLDSNDLGEDIQTEEYISILKKGFPEYSALIEKIVKEENTNILLQELMNTQRKKLLESKKINYAKNLEEIGIAKKRIGQNGNQRLILECLMLKIGKDL